MLVVDDSAVVCRAVNDLLSKDPNLEVVATASNGKIALDNINQLSPDAVVLDVEMPELNGIETLKVIRRHYSSIAVIMFSSLTVRSANATFDALALGADDYVTKPSSLGGSAGQVAAVGAELIAKIKLHIFRRTNSKSAASPLVTTSRGPATAATVATVRKDVDVVVIGVSTGGPNALAELMLSIPGDLPAPILIVQHMPPVFTKILSQRLNANSRVRVEEACPGDRLEAGRAFIAPGNYHMAVHRSGLMVNVQMNQNPPENFCRPSADVLFRSAAAVYGSGTLAVVMTGMGRDGLCGCQAVRSCNGQVVVQDEASSVVWGMPGFVARAGLADAVVPLAELGGEITRRVRKPCRSVKARTIAL